MADQFARTDTTLFRKQGDQIRVAARTGLDGFRSIATKEQTVHRIENGNLIQAAMSDVVDRIQ